MALPAATRRLESSVGLLNGSVDYRSSRQPADHDAGDALDRARHRLRLNGRPDPGLSPAAISPGSAPTGSSISRSPSCSCSRSSSSSGSRSGTRPSGRELFAVGGNPRAALLAGIDVKRVQLGWSTSCRAFRPGSPAPSRRPTQRRQSASGERVWSSTSSPRWCSAAPASPGGGAEAWGTLLGELVMATLRQRLGADRRIVVLPDDRLGGWCSSSPSSSTNCAAAGDVREGSR